MQKIEIEFEGRGKKLGYTLYYYKYNGTQVEKEEQRGDFRNEKMHRGWQLWLG